MIKHAVKLIFFYKIDLLFEQKRHFFLPKDDFCISPKSSILFFVFKLLIFDCIMEK